MKWIHLTSIRKQILILLSQLDSDSYKYFLQQVQNKVSFPREPKVTTDCRKLITKILAPLKVRVKIPQILADTWLNPNQPAKDEEVDTTQVPSFVSNIDNDHIVRRKSYAQSDLH